jgi:hypothetical protein
MQYRREVKTILPILLSDKEQLVMAIPAARQCRQHSSSGRRCGTGSTDSTGFKSAFAAMTV